MNPTVSHELAATLCGIDTDKQAEATVEQRTQYRCELGLSADEFGEYLVGQIKYWAIAQQHAVRECLLETASGMAGSNCWSLMLELEAKYDRAVEVAKFFGGRGETANVSQ